MKWVVDKNYERGYSYDRHVAASSFARYHRRIPTIPGRHGDLFIVHSMIDAISPLLMVGVDLNENDLAASNGLMCSIVRRRPGSDVVRYHPTLDFVALLATHDSGIPRGAQSQRITAAHEAMHAGKRIAVQQHGVLWDNFKWTPAIEETCAHWTGILADIFIEAVMTHHRGIT